MAKASVQDMMTKVGLNKEVAKNSFRHDVFLRNVHEFSSL